MAGLPSVLARAWLAWCLAELGEFPDGITRGEEAVAIAEAADHAYSQVLAAWGLGTLHVVRGDPGRAIPALERGLVLIRVADIPLLFPFVAAPLGVAYALAGRVDEALSHLDQALRQAGSLNLQAHHALRLTWLGETLVLAGQIEQAQEPAEHALALAERLGERGSEAYARRLGGEIARRRTPPGLEGAATAAGDALGLATELGMRPLVARCRLDAALLAERSGAADKARADHAAAVETFRELAMVHWLGQAEALGVGPG
jgi:tetratricopeptide (TPR) repeat protein